MTTATPKPRQKARDWLAGHGVSNPNYRDFRRYLSREPSAEQDRVTRVWTVDQGAPDPRRPEAAGRPKETK